MNRCTVLTFMVVPSVACSRPRVEGLLNADAARACVDHVGDFAAAMSSGNSFDALTGILGMTCASYPTMVMPRGAVTARQYVLIHPCIPFVVTGFAECGATTCRFADYGCGADNIVYEMTGTVAGTVESTALDLTYSWSSKNAGAMAWAIEGSMAIASSAIDGRMHSHGVGESPAASRGSDALVDVAVDYHGVRLDEQRCPIDGAVSATIRYSSVKEDADFEVFGDIAFGPHCGDAD